MPGTPLLRLSTLHKPVAGILSNCLQQMVAYVYPRSLRHHQALVHQASQQVENIGRMTEVRFLLHPSKFILGRGDSLRLLQRPPSGEARDPAEQSSLGFIQQIITPVNEGAKGPLTGKSGRRTARE